MTLQHNMDLFSVNTSFTFLLSQAIRCAYCILAHSRHDRSIQSLKHLHFPLSMKTAQIWRMSTLLMAWIPSILLPKIGLPACNSHACFALNVAGDNG